MPHRNVYYDGKREEAAEEEQW